MDLDRDHSTEDGPELSMKTPDLIAPFLPYLYKGQLYTLQARLLVV